MITSLFRKSTPLNYSIVILGVLFFFFLYQIKHVTGNNSLLHIAIKMGLLAVIFASLFIINFVVKKNGMSKDSAYTVLFYLLFMLFFPSILDNATLLLSNLFIILAMRRIVSLHSLKASKEKIFDASIWVCIAALFHFWSILFILLIFIAVLFHVARDYRNWFLPIIAFCAVAIIFLVSALYFKTHWIEHLLSQSVIDLRMNYFTNNFQNLALSIYATIGLFFVVLLLISMSNRPLILHPTYKKILSMIIIGIAVFAISPNKSNDLLVFTFAPMAMITTTHIETPQAQWKKEVVLALLILGGIFAFFVQL
ncbi:DUF6427 family protein [Flavobacterium sp.]|uniref:DUF6427 family protein n=1 Tax=Flavobacterium sp. TaxID=239 RepID=UPI00286A5C45|nr:DUF6427 family protein [Flavobacterium sp.]